MAYLVVRAVGATYVQDWDIYGDNYSVQSSPGGIKIERVYKRKQSALNKAAKVGGFVLQTVEK